MEFDFEVSNSFRLICNTIKSQCESQHDRRRYEFVELLKCLNPKEKLLAAKYFCQLPWTIGSLRVLHILQQIRLLTATEYILSISMNVEQLQLILNDFLEGEHELLADLFISAAYDSTNGMILSAMLEDALRSLFNDLVVNPKISNLNYMETLREALPADIMSKVVQTHLTILLALHTSDVQDAYGHFSTWINEGVDELNFIKLLCEKLFCNHLQDALNLLFKLSTSEQFKEWKFYLILVQSVASSGNAEIAKFIRKYLQNRLLHIASAPCMLSMLHLLLTARAAAATTMDIQHNLDAYANWYKQNIGEMTYVLSMEKFLSILNLLQDSIAHEMEQEYMEIHAAIAIAPPPLCGKLVQAYKAKCKAHLAQLKRKASRDGDE